MQCQPYARLRQGMPRFRYGAKDRPQDQQHLRSKQPYEVAQKGTCPIARRWGSDAGQSRQLPSLTGTLIGQPG